MPPPIRASVDSNLLLSDLVSRNPGGSATGLVLRSALTGAYTLLLIEGVINEVRQKMASRSDLMRRVPGTAVEELFATLGGVAERVRSLPGPFPEIGRDRKDDFVIAHSIAAKADYLITWDQDLLVLGQVDGVTIVSPPAFLRVLRETGRLMEGEPDSPEDSARGGGQ